MNKLVENAVMDKVLKKLESFGDWLILIHENPDGDTLGCGLAMFSFGLRVGKKARVLGKSCLPDSYLFLPFSSSYEHKPELTSDDVTADTLIICVDTSTVERSVGGLCSYINADNSLNLDHHGDNHMFAGLNVIVSEASATAEIICELLLHNGGVISKKEAECLYTALVTDNGGFKFKSTTAHSLICAARLLEAGVDPSELEDRINQNMTVSTMRLWGTAFCRVEIFACGEAAIFWLGTDDFKRANADFSAIDGLVNLPLRIIDVKIALLLSDLGDAPKLSVRTREPYSAREIAAFWGGGGHIQAAGAKLSMPLEEARKDIKDMVIKYVADRTFTA